MRFVPAVLILALAAATSGYFLIRPRPIPTAAATRKPHPAPRPGVVPQLSPAELGNFDCDPLNPVIPADVQALNGSTVRLRGRMIPLDQASKIQRFALVPPLPPQPLFSPCGAGTTPPLMQQTVIVNCSKNPVGYSPDEVIVKGKLTVGPIRDDGFITGLFSIDMSSESPAVK